jgi:glycosyltransferase involved in cell wall biosynthesis
MESLPLISIITPTLNSGSYIENCLLSVAGQTYGNIEHLIIDGRSTDDTLDIVKRFKARHLHVRLVSEIDNGIYDAMNKGIRQANGEWIYFLGSDDKFYDDYVLTDIFTRKSYRETKIIYGDVLINGDAGWAKDGDLYDGEFTLIKLIEKNICHQAIFYKKTVFDKSGLFNIHYSICADWDMNFRLWARYSFQYKKRLIAIFHGGNKSLKGKNNFSYHDKWMSILKSFKSKLLSTHFTPYTNEFYSISSYYLENRQYIKFLLFRLIYRYHVLRGFKSIG